MAILTDEQLLAVQKQCEAEKTGKEGVKFGQEVVQHVKLMIDVKSAQELLDQKLCNVSEYNSCTLFKAVQYSNHRKITKTGSQKNIFQFDKICLYAWKQFDKEAKTKWQAEARIIKTKAIESKKSETAVEKLKLKSSIKVKIVCCPVCLNSFSSDEFSMHLDAHFPESRGMNVDRNQMKRRSDFEIMLKNDKNLHTNWNREIKALWRYLFTSRKNSNLNQEISECQTLIGELKADIGDSNVYTQVQSSSDQINTCSKDSLIEVHHYVGKFSKTLRYLDGYTNVEGRVGYEFKLAIKKQIQIYFYIAFSELSKESADCIEHCMMIGLFHLDYESKNEDDLPNTWNLYVTSLPKAHKFYTLDLKLLVKVGILLWHEVLSNFNDSIADGSFFESKNLLKYYDSLAKKSNGKKLQKDFIERCGTFEPRRDGTGKRTAKKRKLTTEPTEKDSSAVPVPRTQSALQLATYIQSAIDDGKSIKDISTLLANFINDSDS